MPSCVVLRNSLEIYLYNHHAFYHCCTVFHVMLWQDPHIQFKYWYIPSKLSSNHNKSQISILFSFRPFWGCLKICNQSIYNFIIFVHFTWPKSGQASVHRNLNTSKMINHWYVSSISVIWVYYTCISQSSLPKYWINDISNAWFCYITIFEFTWIYSGEMKMSCAP